MVIHNDIIMAISVRGKSGNFGTVKKMNYFSFERLPDIIQRITFLRFEFHVNKNFELKKLI